MLDENKARVRCYYQEAMGDLRQRQYAATDERVEE